jgi:hypothetical protein
MGRTTLTRNLRPLTRAKMGCRAPGKDRRQHLLQLTNSSRKAEAGSRFAIVGGSTTSISFSDRFRFYRRLPRSPTSGYPRGQLHPTDACELRAPYAADVPRTFCRGNCKTGNCPCEDAGDARSQTAEKTRVLCACDDGRRDQFVEDDFRQTLVGRSSRRG